jgi:hypothetical protein
VSSGVRIFIDAKHELARIIIMETTTLFKIGLKADSNMKKAKKLVNAGYGHADGVAIFKSGSFSTADEVETYLIGLKIPYTSVKVLVPKT